jgi:hypothetical protein
VCLPYRTFKCVHSTAVSGDVCNRSIGWPAVIIGPLTRPLRYRATAFHSNLTAGSVGQKTFQTEPLHDAAVYSPTYWPRRSASKHWPRAQPDNEGLNLRISRFSRGVIVGSGLRVSDDASMCKWLPTFRRNLLPSFSRVG